MADKIVRVLTVTAAKDYVHVFNEDGKTVIKPCSEKEYLDLGKKDAKSPGKGWLFSCERPQFDKPQKKDDVFVLENGDVVLLTGDDLIYGCALLTKTEYDPKLIDNGNGTATLKTSKEVPSPTRAVR